jgi:acyl-coenzyme A synthetase/AMP-(fatty) acid ligase
MRSDLRSVTARAASPTANSRPRRIASQTPCALPAAAPALARFCSPMKRAIRPRSSACWRPGARASRSMQTIQSSATGASRRTRADDVAYIIYTFGSTGTPKGVYQNHRGILHDAMQSIAVGPITPEDHLALFYVPAVIAGLRMMFSGIPTGAAIEVLPPFEFGREGLSRAIQARGVTRMSSSPTLFRNIAGALGADERLDSVSEVILGGGARRLVRLRRLRTRLLPGGEAVGAPWRNGVLDAAHAVVR